MFDGGQLSSSNPRARPLAARTSLISLSDFLPKLGVFNRSVNWIYSISSINNNFIEDYICYHGDDELESDLYELKNVEVINVDNLKDAVNDNYKKRKGEIIKAELYIEEFLVEFDDWTNARLLRPSILSLKKQVRELIVNETLNYNSENKNGDDFNSHLNKVYDKFSNNLFKWEDELKLTDKIVIVSFSKKKP